MDAWAALMHPVNRPLEDRALDYERQPDRLASFLGCRRGHRIGVLEARDGFLAAYLDSLVTDHGAVFAYNTQATHDRFKGLSLCIARRRGFAGLFNVRYSEQAGLPDIARQLDVVILEEALGGLQRAGVDRSSLYGLLMAAVKAGGKVGLVEAAAAPGRGDADHASLGRIEEALVASEAVAAGFVVEAASPIYVNAQDPLTGPAADHPGPGFASRFCLRLRRP